MIKITTKPIGEGVERVAYLHPQDNKKLIKLVKPNCQNIQSKREVNYYNKLKKRKNMSWVHLPKFYGEIATDKGNGFVVELIRDYDGTISKNLDFYLKKCGVDAYKVSLEELKNYFIKEKIVFNYDISPENILVRKIDKNNVVLVLIDGLGDTIFIKVLNHFRYFLTPKILRRWSRFEKKMQRDYAQV